MNAGKKPSLSLEFKKDTETIVTVPPKTEVASEVTKGPFKNKGDSTIICFHSKALNSRYDAGLVTIGINGPKTQAALIKALELNKQFNKKLVVDGKWGTKTKAAIVTLEKRGKRHSYLDSAVSDINLVGTGTEAALVKFQ
ncbi:hypothetical protein IOC57_18055 [Bacillus sp. SD075]|uniref:hypothetical protein n=1 Tax=Bacillus sp. SD075 TaxID=2781732 RepID=UPI001A978047|nr:hypothetical protein [Bacillus sp. SD075]MBO0999636.1 hypothetical protein [Bacillus sp. SD075]